MYHLWEVWCFIRYVLMVTIKSWSSSRLGCSESGIPMKGNLEKLKLRLWRRSNCSLCWSRYLWGSTTNLILKSVGKIANWNQPLLLFRWNATARWKKCHCGDVVSSGKQKQGQETQKKKQLSLFPSSCQVLFLYPVAESQQPAEHSRNRSASHRYTSACFRSAEDRLGVQSDQSMWNILNNALPST